VEGRDNSDALTGDLYAAPRQEALEIVRRQKPPADTA
jgi:hypothetical protein